MSASLGLRQWHHMIVRRQHKHSILVEVIGCIQTALIPRIQLCPSDPNFPFKNRRRRLPIKIALAMTVSKAQGQTLKHVAVYQRSPVFPLDQPYVSFSQSSSFVSVAVATFEGLRQRIGNDTQTDSIKRCISRSAVKFQIYK